MVFSDEHEPRPEDAPTQPETAKCQESEIPTLEDVHTQNNERALPHTDVQDMLSHTLERHPEETEQDSPADSVSKTDADFFSFARALQRLMHNRSSDISITIRDHTDTPIRNRFLSPYNDDESNEGDDDSKAGDDESKAGDDESGIGELPSQNSILSRY